MIDDLSFRQAMGQFATGITVISTKHEDDIVAMTANAFMSISLQPKIIAVSIGEQASMYDVLPETKEFGVSILHKKQQDLSVLFSQDKEYGQADMFVYRKDVPVLQDCLTHLVCDVVKSTKVGDHMVYFGEVKHLEIFSGEPILYYGSEYRHLEDK